MSAFDLGAVSVFREVAVDKAQALKPLEEAAEVFGAFQLLDEAPMVEVATSGAVPDGLIAARRGKLVDECADVCQAVANLLAALGVDGDEWAAAVGRCERRNRDRGRY